jgi:hypothetical protein
VVASVNGNYRWTFLRAVLFSSGKSTKNELMCDRVNSSSAMPSTAYLPATLLLHLNPVMTNPGGAWYPSIPCIRGPLILTRIGCTFDSDDFEHCFAATTNSISFLIGIRSNQFWH